MMKVKSDFYNEIFNGELHVPDVDSILIDSGYLDSINPDIVTLDNIWSICVLLSMVTKSTGTSVLCKHDVQSIAGDNYRGSDIVAEVKAKLLSACIDSNLHGTLERIYGKSDLAKKWEDK